jgi:hypothetical protein
LHLWFCLNFKFQFLASAAEGALQTRPGTDYYERNCDPSFNPKTSGLTGSTVDGFTVSSTAQEGSTGLGGTETTRQFAAQGKSFTTFY